MLLMQVSDIIYYIYTRYIYDTAAPGMHAACRKLIGHFVEFLPSTAVW